MRHRTPWWHQTVRALWAAGDALAWLEDKVGTTAHRVNRAGHELSDLGSAYEEAKQASLDRRDRARGLAR